MEAASTVGVTVSRILNTCCETRLKAVAAERCRDRLLAFPLEHRREGTVPKDRGEIPSLGFLIVATDRDDHVVGIEALGPDISGDGWCAEDHAVHHDGKRTGGAADWGKTWRRMGG